jgi:hypothetical protein
MKRLLTAAAIAALVVLSGSTASAYAATTTSGPTPASADLLWMYSGQYYTGEAKAVDIFQGGGYKGFSAHSVINKSQSDMCGYSLENQSIFYYFWKGGSWPTIGSPFNNSQPLDQIDSTVHNHSC